jgi:hypothetical protein
LAAVMENAKEAINLYLETLTVEEKRFAERKSCGYTKSESSCLKFRVKLCLAVSVVWFLLLSWLGLLRLTVSLWVGVL